MNATSPATRPLEDLHGHLISYLRISVTDRCNERCTYCMPEEEQIWHPRAEILTYEEILRLVRVAVNLGVSKVRVTGGEPLVRRDVLGFLEELGRLSDAGLTDIGLSTNATLLAQKAPDGNGTHAERVKAAGVRSVNISLDSLDAETYRRTTGRDFLGKALAGVDAAIGAGIESVKLNCVLMKGRTEAELFALLDFAREKGVKLRFIELMPVSTQEVLKEDRFFTAGLAKRIIELKTGELRFRPDIITNGPSRYFEVPETGQVIGFIGAMTDFHFCERCNKLRLTCDGKLRPCLGSHLEFDVRDVLRSGASDEAIADVIRTVVLRKPKEHDFRDNYEPGRRMVAIGG
ncbi:MAG: GTP 3',8-cyclase MoaA [Verrucomicrobiota bacterium]